MNLTPSSANFSSFFSSSLWSFTPGLPEAEKGDGDGDGEGGGGRGTVCSIDSCMRLGIGGWGNEWEKKAAGGGGGGTGGGR